VKTPVYKIIVTLVVVGAAAWAGYLLYSKYSVDPWTRDCQVRANVIGIAPRVAGPVIKIPVHDNQQVQTGDLLFEIDPAPYEAALESAQGQVATAEVGVLQKKQDLDRQTDLFQRHVNSKEDFQDAQNAYASADAQLKTARANLKTAQLNLSYTKVYAPVDGYLTNVNTSEGSYVQAGQQLLALVDASSFWVAAYFKETQLPAITEGRKVRVTLLGYPHDPFEGIVNSVAWGIYISDGSGGDTTELLPAVSQTIDWVRLPQRFPVRIKITGKPPVPLRIGQTVSAALEPLPSRSPQAETPTPKL
jgi:multidrug resistance efflux pump